MSKKNVPGPVGTSTRGDLHAEGALLVNAQVTAQVAHAIAHNGLADALATGSRTGPQLAQVTSNDEAALRRVLRAGANLGLVRISGEHYELTGLGLELCGDGSLHDWAEFVGDPDVWAAMGRLRESVRTGEAAYPTVTGSPFYADLARKPAAARRFERMMASQSAAHDEDILDAADFSRFTTVVDIGGGTGATLAAVLGAAPRATGVVFDRSEVVAQIDTSEQEPGIASRMTAIGGDFLVAVPHDVDCYVIKRVLSDLDDVEVLTLLSLCRDGLRLGGRVMVVTQTVDEDGRHLLNALIDVLFLVMFGPGRMRSVEDLARLADGAGLRVESSRAAGAVNTLVTLARCDDQASAGADLR